ncbi:MAG: c-type cytochrome biogenesis protein CcmI [Gammaproteobacteria bacterium]
MSFILLAALMLLTAAACVAIPLWRAHPKQRPSTDAANRAVHSARIEELDRDLAAGRLAQEDYAAAHRDLDTELDVSLRDAQHDRERAAKTHGSSLVAGIVALLMITVAGVLYWQLGSWRAGVEGVQQASVFSVEQMVVQLAHRLKTTDPNDLPGWEMLGHAYLLMGRYADAADAYSHARTLSADGNAEVLASYGEAVSLASPDDFMGKAMPAFEKALQLEPSNPQALWYGGLGALERGDKNLAVSRWQALLTQNPPPEYRAIIEKSIVAAGGTLAPAGQANATQASTVAAIHIRVTLAASLRGKVSPDETLFVFAEPAGQGAGPPLAVRRFQVRDLPLNVTLSDADSMLDGRKLSAFAKVNIVARISKNGAPMPQAGDLTGQILWHTGANMPVHIQISTILP